MVLMAALPGVATAQDAWIRIEAKRGAAAETAAEGWRAQHPDVRTFRLPNGFTGIALGPMPVAEAAARMARLKAAGQIPADSYLTEPGGTAPLSGIAAAAAAAGPDAAVPLGDAPAADAPGTAVAPPTDAGAPAGAEPADTHIQLQATPGRISADQALARWRARFPEAGLWRLPGGMYAVALSAETAEAAGTRLRALKAADQVPADAYLATTGDLGTVIEAGGATGAPGSANTAGGVEGSPVAVAPPTTGTGPAPVPPAEPQAAVATNSEESSPLAPPAAASSTESAPLTAPANEAEGVTVPGTGADAGDATTASVPDATTNPAGTAGQTPPASATAGGPTPAPIPAADPADTAAGPPPAATAAPGAPAASTAGLSPDPLPPGALPPPEPIPAVMPPIVEVQRALRWAGHYDGPLDGQSGPGTRAAMEAEIEASSPGQEPAEAMVALIARRDAWRQEMGLGRLEDEATGLGLTAPLGRLAFDRVERGLSIYGPKDGSGAALILTRQAGGQQEMLDFAGLVTALGWVPQPQRQVTRDSVTLEGAGGEHMGHAEARVVDGQVEGWVLIWPAADAENGRRLAVEIAETLGAAVPVAAEPAGDAVAAPVAGSGG